jgi:putative SOS response-associated peptidase YedK
MCGRFALYAKEEEIISHFSLSTGFSMKPRYNIAPTQTIPIVRKLHHPIDFFRWGFIPFWEKAQSTPPLPVGYINARIETAAQKPAFKRAFEKQRCIIPATGYYEWRTINAKKQPYYIHFPDEPLIGMAGIWSMWKDERGIEHGTCAILTQEAPEKLQSLHPRSPVILQSAAYEAWLSASKEETLSLENISVQAVTPRMNRPDFDTSAILIPV